MEKMTDRIKIIESLRRGTYVPHNIIGILENRDSDAYVSEIGQAVWVENDYFNYVYGDPEAIKSHLESLSDGYYGFSGVYSTLAEAIYKPYLLHWFEPTDRYLFDGDKNEAPCPYDIVSIGPEEADGIDERYEYRQEGSLDRIKDAILNRPTSAIYQNGEIASYVLVHEDNSIGYMYTKPEYRELGLAYWVTCDIISKMKAINKIPFVEINQRNLKSQGLAHKTHLMKDVFTPWFGIIKGTPDWMKTWEPLEGASYILTTLIHLKLVGGVTSEIEAMKIEKIGEDYLCQIDEGGKKAHFQLINDPSNEAYVLKIMACEQLSLYEILCALTKHFPDANTPIVTAYDENLVELIGCIVQLR